MSELYVEEEIGQKEKNVAEFSIDETDIGIENEFQEEEELKTLCSAVKGSMREGRFQEAEPLIIKAMEQYPESPVPHNLYGLLLEEEKKHPQAMKHFRAAYALEPSYGPAKHNMEIFGGMNPLGKAAYCAAECRKKQSGILMKLNVLFMRG